jgi:hypothetical protein
MRIVSENSEAEVARHQAEWARDDALNKASWALREFTANILRVTEIYSAEQSIIRGALQIAASRLIGQRTQEATGHREMYDGLQRLEAIKAQIRKRLRASANPARRRKNEWDDLLDKDASRANAEPARRRATKRRIGKDRRAGEGTKT